ncbi:selenide, water dikinase SelD [Phaeobacter sp. B1627]|uniref:selenide, water dikinase SelD n=1 Tax=Phaeobacter sp. B1627 TaxID=2583809 RepID=UPI001118061A|nr:selenide, water dikinase SelD [Phaeobacter sp. B1627]TNJ43948.1 selenide, water dikinase SelD [Phaeobacter sp. B1627]
MIQPHLPLTRDLVLVGGGHSHALVLRMWGMKPLPGVRLTLINPGPTAPYSGMLPGFVAGHYDREALDIDLVRLARFAGARLVPGAAEGIDPIARRISVPGRPAIAYDLASIDIGITSAMPALPGFADHAVPAKPLGAFAAAWDSIRQGEGPVRIACIGGGVAGAELLLAMAYALRQQGRLAGATLIDRGAALSTLGPRSQSRLRDALRAHDIEIREHCEVTEITARSVCLGDGSEIASDFTVGAAGAKPYSWLATSGLQLHEGALVVSPGLRTSDEAIFASGDCAHMAHAPRPKAGVYAVRQAPVLFHNLQATLAGGRLKSYQPQADYLKLISMGAKTALADRGGRSFAGPVLWRWKDHIDRSFMAKFAKLPVMAMPALPRFRAKGLDAAVGDKPLCGGCGSKVGRRSLQAGLGHFTGASRPDVTRLPGDDAAQLSTGGATQVLTTDHLRAFTEDPVTLTQITAEHALNDIYAMGGDPQAATVTLILPRQSPALQERLLAEIAEAADAVMSRAGAAIVGGHTSLGSELTVGFTVTGLCDTAPVTLAGAQPGDHLILTKPLGSGTILAAEMSGQARGRWVQGALDLMRQSQRKAAEILRDEAHAMTDVTGFGLMGHLQGICAASALGADIRFGSIPTLRGAPELAEAGLRSTLFAENAALVPDLVVTGARALVFDPQTSGGLLAAVSPDQSEILLNRLRNHGYRAAVIGRMTETGGGITLR